MDISDVPNNRVNNRTTSRKKKNEKQDGGIENRNSGQNQRQ